MNTVIKLGLLLVVALSGVRSAFSAPFNGCNLGQPSKCQSINDLRDAPGFSQALNKFFGSTKSASYFQAGLSLSDQAALGLGGPPADRMALPNGLYLFSACPPHDCAGNGAAVVLSGNGQIVAVGFSSFHCGKDCDIRHRYLDFYLRGSSCEDNIVAILEHWGLSRGVRSTLHDLSVDEGLDGRTSVHILR